MKRILILLPALLACAPLFAAEPAATNTPTPLQRAVTKLKAETNYSWTVKVEMANSQFTLEPLQGQIEKSGYMFVTQDFMDSHLQAAFKGTNVAVNTGEQWELFDADGTEFNMGWFVARTKSAADDAADLISKAKALKAGDGGLWSSDLTDEGATSLLSFGPRRAGGDGPPPPKNAKASVKFWTTNDSLVKFETHMTGQVSFGGDEQDMDMTRTTEIHDQGKTKVNVPDEARKKLEAK